MRLQDRHEVMYRYFNDLEVKPDLFYITELCLFFKHNSIASELRSDWLHNFMICSRSAWYRQFEDTNPFIAHNQWEYMFLNIAKTRLRSPLQPITGESDHERRFRFAKQFVEDDIIRRDMFNDYLAPFLYTVHSESDLYCLAPKYVVENAYKLRDGDANEAALFLMNYIHTRKAINEHMETMSEELTALAATLGVEQLKAGSVAFSFTGHFISVTVSGYQYTSSRIETLDLENHELFAVICAAMYLLDIPLVSIDTSPSILKSFITRNKSSFNNDISSETIKRAGDIVVVKQTDSVVVYHKYNNQLHKTVIGKTVSSSCTQPIQHWSKLLQLEVNERPDTIGNRLRQDTGSRVSDATVDLVLSWLKTQNIDLSKLEKSAEESGKSTNNDMLSYVRTNYK